MPYQVQNRDLHHTLVEVGRAIFDNLDGNNFLGLEVLTFDNLAKGTLAQNVENKVSVPILQVSSRYRLKAAKTERHQSLDILVAGFL